MLPATNVDFFGATSITLLSPPLSFVFEYNQSESTASITGVTLPAGSSSLHVNIPADVNTSGIVYQVTSIGQFCVLRRYLGDLRYHWQWNCQH